MSYPLSTMIVFAVTLLNVTTHLVCAVLLLWKRREMPDRSRTILALPWLMAVAVFVNKMLMLGLHPEANATMEVLSPMIIFTTPIPQLLLLAYPVEVMRPRWMTFRRVLPMLIPWIVLCVPAFFVGSGYFTPLHSTADLAEHMGEWNVWWRLMVIPLIIFNATLPLMLPYRWRESSASRVWIRAYVMMICVLAMLLLSWMITQNPVLQVCHTLCALTIAAVFTWFELVERVVPVPMEAAGIAVLSNGAAPTDDAASLPGAEPSDTLWLRITTILPDEELWRNPDLSLDMLSERVKSNRNYVSQCFRQNAATTFNDYVNRLRVDYMAEELKHHPFQSHKELYFRAGFRSKTAAFTNFKKYKQKSPTEFLVGLQEGDTEEMVPDSAVVEKS